MPEPLEERVNKAGKTEVYIGNEWKEIKVQPKKTKKENEKAKFDIKGTLRIGKIVLEITARPKFYQKTDKDTGEVTGSGRAGYHVFIPAMGDQPFFGNGNFYKK